MGKIKEFFTNFIGGLNNSKSGHSLKKWLAIGVFWLIVVITIRYTCSTNLEGVLVILASLLVTLMGLNVADKKIKTQVTKDISGQIAQEDPNNPVI